MLAPAWMEKHAAPSSHGQADPRMNLRGFGSAHVAIAVHTLTAARSREGARTVLGLNALVDALDTTVSLLEWRARGKLDPVVAGGVVLNLAGLTCWSAAAAALRHGQQ
jgi:hypothetical protein